jgi:Xaa-Pro aminopeptidase
MSEALRAARPAWTEWELAGAGAEALWARGLHPALTLAAGAGRLPRYRHPIPTQAPLGTAAMLVFCARGKGLYANLTRFVQFAPPTAQQQHCEAALLGVEAAGLQTCRPGRTLAEAYAALAQAYRAAAFPNAIREHHQGGVTGYLAREHIATPETPLELQPGMALAFNPSLPGAKLEDTFLLHANGLENLTLAPDWPSVVYDGRPRPLPLEAS